MKIASIISDYDIQALVDNELDWESQKRIEWQIQNDPQLQSRYTELMRQKKLLQNWWTVSHMNN